MDAFIFPFSAYYTARRFVISEKYFAKLIRLLGYVGFSFILMGLFERLSNEAVASAHDGTTGPSARIGNRRAQGVPAIVSWNPTEGDLTYRERCSRRRSERSVGARASAWELAFDQGTEACQEVPKVRIAEREEGELP